MIQDDWTQYPVPLEKNPDWGPKSRWEQREYAADPHAEWKMVTPFTWPADRLQRRLDFEPGHAWKNHFGAGMSNNYGIAAMVMRFLVAGPRGVTQFSLATGWYPDIVQGKYGPQLYAPEPSLSGAMGFDLGYHALHPQYDSQRDESRECQYTSTGRCFYDGSGLRAANLHTAFIMTGDVDVVWAALVAEHDRLKGPDELEGAPRVLPLEGAQPSGPAGAFVPVAAEEQE